MARSLRDTLERRRHRTSVLQTVLEFVRAESAGQERPYVRDLLQARLLSSGLTPPVADSVIDTMADVIMSEGKISRKGKLAADVLVKRIASGISFVRRVHDLSHSDGVDILLSHDPIMVDFDRSTPPLQVNLDPGVQAWLREVTDVSIAVAAGGHPREVFVLLSNDDAGNPGQVSVSVSQRRLGTLGSSDGMVFHNVIESGAQTRRPVVGQAAQELDADGQWRIMVYHPR